MDGGECGRRKTGRSAQVGGGPHEKGMRGGSGVRVGRGGRMSGDWKGVIPEQHTPGEEGAAQAPASG